MNTSDWRHIEAGDKEAYSQAYIFYYKKFYNYGRKFTENEVLLEDTIQEILMDLWKNKERLSAIAFPHTYLFTAFRRLLFKKIKQDARFQHYLAEAEPEFGPEHFIIREETDVLMRQRLRQALATLTARQREAIFLRFYEALSYEEVADIMNISVRATYKVVARALLELKQTLSLPMLSVLLLLRSGTH
ncbi:MAG: RNA polymerase sigma factor [Bacteroidetes bacterium]|nr:RNA polymerase sigma factor [Bacteroidota bacterium]